MTSMLRERWNRLMGGKSATAVEHEVEKEQMTAAERHEVEESIDDRKADVAATEHFGGVVVEDESPPS